MAKQKLSEEVIKIAKEQISQGGSKRQLALSLKVSPNTVSEWIKKGRESEEDNLHRRFYLAIQWGEAEAEQQLLDRVQDAASGKLKSRKIKTVRDGGGNIIQTIEEESSSVQLKAILWQLEHKYGWGNHITREKERVLNLVVRLAEKSLNPDQFRILIQEIMESKLSDELNLDPELLCG